MKWVIFEALDMFLFYKTILDLFANSELISF